MNRSRLHIAKADIVRHFDALPRHVFSTKDIQDILTEQRGSWRLAKNTAIDQFVEFLAKHSKLRVYDFPFPQRTAWCYGWGDVPLLAVLMGLKKDLHFSHHTAMQLHGLAGSRPEAIYLTEERITGSMTAGPFTQEAIDGAFRKPARTSNNWVAHEGLQVYLLNGAATGHLGVETTTIPGASGPEAQVRATNLERTLIDITVKPEYAGGPLKVARAYELAKDRLSIDKLLTTLDRLGFAYPYHQAIGLYLQRAEIESSLLDSIRMLPREYDFYIAHNMGDTRYDANWRLHIPADF
ncbi:hypothetical protein [Caenimonas soli]|uniref:hypothetical protein n=1 Tax=Caenimonas soli TaxID=2735555 RepID=UPI001554E931|nr:hypothetical protein [Caenimonas soli]NPC57828.1 hypothetical protein [Caenimonas soli]